MRITLFLMLFLICGIISIAGILQMRNLDSDYEIKQLQIDKLHKEIKSMEKKLEVPESSDFKDYVNKFNENLKLEGSIISGGKATQTGEKFDILEETPESSNKKAELETRMKTLEDKVKILEEKIKILEAKIPKTE